jgi:DNA-binding response OmpR family regulator
LQAVWGDEDADIRYRRVYIGQLREKLESDAEHPALIQAVAGYGYEFT